MEFKEIQRHRQFLDSLTNCPTTKMMRHVELIMVDCLQCCFITRFGPKPKILTSNSSTLQVCSLTLSPDFAATGPDQGKHQGEKVE